ncbi:MAG: LON peptidase substrate-binding domain-containing protein [Candidatus Thermoplasmatota archaeon]|nr:LON peptidase substrate-binding domain-containing protein [Candidatus Thermoplasmatota archaeon]
MPTLPLFPLDIVVYPGENLALHIFEERYCLMVEECLHEGRPFGIALIRQDEPEGHIEHEAEGTGTAVKILSVDQLSDGRYLLEVEGTQRFAIERVESRRPYQEATVTWLDEDVGDPGQAEIFSREVLEALLNQGSLEGPPPPMGPIELSYVVAASLQAPLTIKQVLLEVPSADERLALEAGLLAPM